MNNHYIIICRDTHYMLVGPFETHEESCKWGHKHGWGPGGEKSGDPRWQKIQLAPENINPVIMAPKTARVPA